MNDAFDKLTNVLDSAYGAPGVVIVLAWCIGIGYFLKMTSWVDNRRIPFWVVSWGMFWNVLLRPLPVIPSTNTTFETIWFVAQHIGRLVAIGFMIGLVATLLYDKALKGLEARWPWLGSLLTPDAGTILEPAKLPVVTTTTTTTVDGGGTGQPTPKT